jgi:hypothetical protein
MPHGYEFDEDDGTAIGCIRGMMNMYDKIAEEHFDRSNELKDPKKCRVCERQHLVNGVEVNYRVAQARADMLRWALKELEQGCQAL